MDAVFVYSRAGERRRCPAAADDHHGRVRLQASTQALSVSSLTPQSHGLDIKHHLKGPLSGDQIHPPEKGGPSSGSTSCPFIY